MANVPNGPFVSVFLSEKTDMINPIIVNEAYLLPDFFRESSVGKYSCGIDSK